MPDTLQQSPTDVAKAYRPATRHVAAEILTSSGWIGGSIVLPQLQSLADHLSKAGPIVKITSARLPGRAEEVPFFALRSSAVAMVVPASDERAVNETIGTDHTRLSVMFLMDHGVLRGQLVLPAKLRLSDFLRQQTGFFALHDAQWARYVAAGQPNPTPRTFRCVLVNAPAVIGAEES